MCIHCVSFVTPHMKSAGLRIRIEPELRDAFVRACNEKDQSAAQVIRAFIRSYLDKDDQLRQTDLFDLSKQLIDLKKD